MSYKHGVYTAETPTSIVPARTVESAVVFVVGTAPVHLLPEGAPKYVNDVRLYNTYNEFVQEMGWDDEHFDAFTLQEAAYASLALYGGGPLLAVNVFDPARHCTEVGNENVTFASEGAQADTARLAHPGVTSLTLKKDGTPLSAGVDYTLDAASGTLFRLPDGAIAAGAEVSAAYSFADVEKVTAADIIGGIDAATGAAAGFELLDEVFPRYRMVPSILLAPRFCENPDVAVVMAAKAANVNGLFKAICLVDVPTSGQAAVTRYTDVPGYKEKNNLTDELMVVCWPKVKLGDKVMSLSAHLAGVMASTDADHDSIPYASPSNQRLDITSCGFVDATGVFREVWLDLPKANYLNGQGVCTVSGFDGGLKTWGGRMACYPSNTDPKDAQDAIRRFFNWYQTQFILTYFVKVDQPLTRRLVQTFLKSEQIKLDGYAARGIILGGKITFESAENPTTDLIDGIMRFHLRITPPPAARDIEAIFEFDPDNLQTLFG